MQHVIYANLMQVAGGTREVTDPSETIAVGGDIPHVFCPFPPVYPMPIVIWN